MPPYAAITVEGERFLPVGTVVNATGIPDGTLHRWIKGGLPDGTLLRAFEELGKNRRRFIAEQDLEMLSKRSAAPDGYMRLRDAAERAGLSKETVRRHARAIQEQQNNGTTPVMIRGSLYKFIFVSQEFVKNLENTVKPRSRAT